MKVVKLIKWIFSLLILVITLAGIIWGTNYVLNNKGIRVNVKERIKKTVEKVNSNESKNNLAEIYNIYLNKERHKVKIEYQLISRSDGSQCVNLYVYFDGKNSFEREVAVLQDIIEIHDVFLVEDIWAIIKITENSFHILKDGDIEYLLIDMGIVQESNQKYYYILDNNGDIMNELGILVSDSAKDYVDINNDSFNNYYDNENRILAKIEENIIYALEEETIKNKLNLVEYKYYFEENKLKKEKVVTFEDIKLNDKEKL